MFSCEFYKISENTFFYRTPLRDCSIKSSGFNYSNDIEKFLIKVFC